MRTKDAITVALILGRELRHATPDEVAGLETAIGAVRGHMLHVHADTFDPSAFDSAVERGRSGGLGW